MRYLTILASLLLLVTSVNCTPLPPSNKFGVPSSVERSIQAWQAENNIELSEDAFKLLVQQLDEGCASCTATYHFQTKGTRRSIDPPEHASAGFGVYRGEESAKDPGPSSQAASQPVVPPAGELRQAFQQYYLDQLRDINTVKGERPVIEPADIMSYSFTSFLKDVGFGKEPFGPVGRLIVQSRPNTAFITINGKRKGYTNKRFVVNAGTYQVKINEPRSKLSCDEKIVVDAYETRIMMCESSS